MTLIDRLSKLDGPDREVDAEIAKSIGGLKANREFGMGGNWWDRWTDDGLTVGVPSYTFSVDAAIALAERVLAGKARKIVWEEGKAIVVISQASRLSEVAPTVVQTHSHAAIALCIAILRTKEASHGE